MKRRGLYLGVFFFVHSIALGGGPWYVPYEKALQAQAGGKWQESIRLLEESVNLRAEPRAKARTYGMRFVNYLPYYYMGVGYLNLHDSAKAVALFEKESSFKQIHESPEFEKMQKYLGRTELIAPATGVAKAEEVVSPVLPAAGMPWYVSYEAALAYIESGDWLKAEDLLKSALTDNSIPRQYSRTYGMWFISYLPYYHLGMVYYRQGLWKLAEDFFDASERFGVVKQFSKEFVLLQQYKSEAKSRSVSDGSTPENTREKVNKKLLSAIQSFHAEDYAQARVEFGGILQLDPHNSVAKAYLARVPTVPPDDKGVDEVSYRHQQNDYMAGLQKLFQGKYDDAIALLQPLEQQYAREPAFNASLGSAYAAKYFAASQKDKALLGKANDYYTAALTLDPGYSLDSRVFPEPVVTLYIDVRKKIMQK